MDTTGIEDVAGGEGRGQTVGVDNKDAEMTFWMVCYDASGRGGGWSEG
ncbi:MAG: hypothetical protein J6T03_03890 [Bacteroidales bacterium]|nr:hypothetical protein [Bacteroidales bacterium]